MNVEIEWAAPLLLAQNSKLIDIDFSGIEDEPGVYFFSRKFGDAYTPFYIGRTQNLRTRLKQHLASAKIQLVLRGITDKGTPKIGQGAKHFHCGYFRPKPGQKWDPCTRIVERYLIQAALEEEIELVNLKLTKIPTHQVEFTGSKLGRGMFSKSAKIQAK